MNLWPNDSPPISLGDPLALPPGISSEKFKEYIGRAAEIVGEESVTIITKLEELKKKIYANLPKPMTCFMFHVFNKSYFVASAVVAPHKEVQTLISLSNKTVISVCPFLVAAPRVPGSIGLEMGRHVNMVLEINNQAHMYWLSPV